MEAPYGFVEGAAPPFPEEVALFVERKGLQQAMPEALRLVRESFVLLGEPQLEVQADPDSDDEWVAMHITIKGTVDEVLAGYREYVRQLVRAVPWSQRCAIHLSYHIRNS